jgi:hypothetical protein
MMLGKVLGGLAYVGGLFATIAAVVLLTRRRQVVGAFVAGAVVLLAVTFLFQPFRSASGVSRITTGGWFYSQLAVFAAGGFVLLLEAGRSWWRHWRDADAALLALWILGTLAFATMVNWSTNARALLPVGPAAAILLLRPQGLRRAGADGAGEASPVPFTRAASSAARSLGQLRACQRVQEAHRAMSS